MTNIRKFNRATDNAQLRQCVVELQDYERLIDPRMPRGKEIANEYIGEMLKRCRDCDGQVLVAEIDGQIAGYVTLLARVQSDDLDDGDLEFGLIADLLVREPYRRTGLGRELISAAETLAKASKVRWLRISVMAANASARKLYASTGFSEIYVELEKDLGEAEESVTVQS